MDDKRKRLQDLIKIAISEGWVVELKPRSSHYKWVSPRGEIVFTSSTPSDRRALERIQSDLRRSGLDVRVLTRKGNK